MRKIFPTTIVLSLFYVTAFSQNTGIGTNVPTSKLHVNGSINTDSIYRINGKIALSVEGTQNTFVGIDDLAKRNFTASINNTATGYQALYYNSYGSPTNNPASNNTGIGYHALYANATSSNNTSSGYFASRRDKGYRNTAIGSRANFGDSSSQYGTFNTAMGSRTLYSLTDGASNVAYGENSMYSNTGGYGNVAIGARTLEANQTGLYNTAMGFGALFRTTLGYNVALGARALADNTTGEYNTAAGFRALYRNGTSKYNAAAGYVAASSFNVGYNNTVIGANADLSFDGQYNAIAVGNLATCPDNSTVRIGNSANWSYGGYANWTNLSDARFKKNIRENVVGLRFIMGLRPVIYQMNATALNKKLSGKEPDDTMKAVFAEKESMIYNGFIAQEVEAVAEAAGFTFSGINKPINDKDVYGLRYDEFVVPLVKAIQEQQAIIESLQNELLAIKEVNRQIIQNRQSQNSPVRNDRRY